VTIFMPDWMSRERRDLIASFGARVETVSREGGGFLGCIARAEALAAEDRRSSSRRSSRTRRTPSRTKPPRGRRFWNSSSPPGCASTRSSRASARAARSWASAARAVATTADPRAPDRAGGIADALDRVQVRAAPHPGISDEFVPAGRHLAELNEVIAVHDGDAILMAQKLARELGLGVGISSGANLAGAIALANRMGGGAWWRRSFPIPTRST
jgi:cysteine synthase A